MIFKCLQIYSNIKTNMSEIQQFYKDKHVFLTGGTGFLGKLIIQKLLKTTEVKTISLIVRPKRGVSVEGRTKQLLDHELFFEVKHNIGKVKAYAGDLSKLGLALSEDDREYLENDVNIIIHCGAHMNMVSSIQESVFSNVRSTREILEIARKCKHLISFVYVSTAYSHCLQSVIEEKFHQSPISANVLIKMCEDMDEDILTRKSPELRGEWPNYYTFTKAVAESLIQEAKKDIPIGLFRPSIITSTVEEPLKGWTDNLHGPLGILLSINMGLIRTIRSKPSVKLDLVPADKVINAVLCMAWEINQRGVNFKPLVLNFSGRNSSIYIDQIQLWNKSGIAMKAAFWYPMCLFIYNPLLFLVFHHLLHTIPYFVVDTIALLCGRTPKASWMFEKVMKACDALCFFMTNEWTIQNDNVVALWNKLSDEDKRMYNFDVSTINAQEYFQSFARGLKQYLAKEDISEIAKDEKRLRWLKLIHFLMVGILLVLLFLLIKVVLVTINSLS